LNHNGHEADTGTAVLQMATELGTADPAVSVDPPGGAPPTASALPVGGDHELVRPQVEEILLCSSDGGVLHEWHCLNLGARLDLLEFVARKSRQMAQGLALGSFDRFESRDAKSRVVSRIQEQHALFVRASRFPAVSEPPLK
jgi:hypothetical protein